MAGINTLKGLDEPVRQGYTQRASEQRQRQHQRQVSDFLVDLSNMLDDRKYRFASDTLDGIYTTVDHSQHVSEGQRRAVNNIRRGCGEGDL